MPGPIPQGRRPVVGALALPACLTWGVAQLGALAADGRLGRSGLIAGLLSPMLRRRRESIVYFWVAALFYLLFVLTGNTVGA